MTQNDTDIRPLSQEEHDAAIERMRSYDALPERECAEKLRAEVRDFESRILAITGDPLETCWWDTVKPENVSEYVDDLIGLRHYALTRLFEIHCTEAGFHNERLSHIVFCYASHAIITHKDFTIPDYMRMDEYEVKVDIRYQHFRKTE